MKRKNHLPDAAAEFTHTAAERSADLRDSIVEAITPLLEQAQENLGPIAQDTKKKGAAFAASAFDKAQPRLNDALDSVTPTVDSAREHVQENWIPKLSEVLHTAAELPEIAGAAALAGGEAAREMSKKQLKKANKSARKQAKKDAKQFGRSSKKAQDQALAQLKDALPQPQHKGRNTFLSILAALSVVGGIIWLVKKYLGEDSEAGWAAHEPSKAYTQRVEESESEGMVATPPPMADAAVKDRPAGTVKEKTTDDAKDKAADVAGAAKDKLGEVADAAKAKAADLKDGAAKLASEAQDKAADAADAAKDKAADAKDGAAKVADQAKDKAADAADAAKDKAADAKDGAAKVADQAADKASEAKDKAADKASDVKDKAADAADAAKDKAADAKDAAKDKAADVAETEKKEYGPNAFVGENAPAEFVVKGNERSMKYHTQGTSGYDRTIADVWFKNEQDAEAAGFTKAQR